VSYTFPASIEHEIEQYALAEHISQTEAAVRLLQTGLNAMSRKDAVTPLSDEELTELCRRFPALNALSDVTEEQWDRIEDSVRRMKQAELSTSA